VSFLQTTADLFRYKREIRHLIRDYLFFRRHPEQGMWGSLNKGGLEELLRLVKLAAQYPGPIIEIGTLFGLTTQQIATAKRPDQELITVDNYTWNPFKLPREHHIEFTTRVLHHCAATTDLKIVRSGSGKFFERYSGPAPAMVFIDAAHDYDFVVSEIRHAKRLGAHIICGDDFSPKWPDIERAVREEFGDRFQVKDLLWSAQNAP
jgi:hypothetical protein